jgi:hypothetical protein
MAMHEVVIRFEAAAFATGWEAVRHARERGKGEAIRLNGESLVVSRDTAQRLAAAGVAFSHLFANRGEVLAFPVND